MNRSWTMLSTQIAYHLSLTATVKNSGETRLAVLQLISLTGVIFWLLSIRQVTNQLFSEGLYLTVDVIGLTKAIGMAVRVYLMCIEIITKSVWFGVTG